MKQIKLNNFSGGWKPNFKLSNKVKFGLVLIAAIATLALGVWILKETNAFFEKKRFQFNKPVTVILKQPIEIVEREYTITQIIQGLEKEAPIALDTPIKEYICEKFGEYECRVALAVTKAESGFREDAVGVNTNGSIDVGLMQINSINWKIPGCSLKEVVDPYKNVDCGYIIWDRADGEEGNGKGQWTPWVAFTTGRFAGSY